MEGRQEVGTGGVGERGDREWGGVEWEREGSEEVIMVQKL